MPNHLTPFAITERIDPSLVCSSNRIFDPRAENISLSPSSAEADIAKDIFNGGRECVHLVSLNPAAAFPALVVGIALFLLQA